MQLGGKVPSQTISKQKSRKEEDELKELETLEKQLASLGLPFD